MIYNDQIFFINQDNVLVSLNLIDGTKLWDVRTATSFIKSQNLLALAISKKGYLAMINSSGDLMKIDTSNAAIKWSLNPTDFSHAQQTDFFTTSDIVIDDDEVFFSSSSITYSINFENGNVNWEKAIVSHTVPIIDRNNVFLVSKNGYFVNLDKGNGEIIWSTNVLKVLKQRKQKTEVTGFILGSGKIYVTTLNGYIIICSASSGKVENFIKISDNITTSPIINNGSLFILADNSKIMGFN